MSLRYNTKLISCQSVAWESPCSCGQSRHILAKKERWSEGHRYAKTCNLLGICSKTVFRAGHRQAGPDVEVRHKCMSQTCSLFVKQLLALCLAQTEIEIRAFCATYQHERRVTVPQTFCPNNHSKNWEGKLRFANKQSKKLSCLSLQKQLQGLVLKKAARLARSLPSL